MHSAEKPESKNEKSPDNSSTDRKIYDESPAELDPREELAAGRSLASFLYFISIGLFVISLFCKVIQFGVHTDASNQYFDPNMPTYGFAVVLFGWSRFIFAISSSTLDPMGALLHYIGLLGWFANPALIVSAALFFFSRRLSMTLSIVALCLGLISLAIIGEHDQFHVMADSAPLDEAFRLMDGYMYWIGSIIMMAIANAVMFSYENRFSPQAQAQTVSASKLFDEAAARAAQDPPKKS